MADDAITIKVNTTYKIIGDILRVEHTWAYTGSNLVPTVTVRDYDLALVLSTNIGIEGVVKASHEQNIKTMQDSLERMRAQLTEGMKDPYKVRGFEAVERAMFRDPVKKESDRWTD